MTLMLQFRDAEKLTPLIWTASGSPQELAWLIPGQRAEPDGSLTVVLARGKAPESEGSELLLPARDIHVLNLGVTEDVVIVFTTEKGHEDELPLDQAPFRFGPKVQHDDQRFLRDAAAQVPRMTNVAETILSILREIDPTGYLQYATTSGRFVERPKNFFAIKVQPVDKSFRVVIKGKPGEFVDKCGFVLKKDRGSYSSFKVRNTEEAVRAKMLIRQASQA